MNCTVYQQEVLADGVTPLGLYRRLREQSAESLLLESADYQARENSYSFICLEPLASIQLKDGLLEERLQGQVQQRPLAKGSNPAPALQGFLQRLRPSKSSPESQRFNGLFGHCNFESSAYFDTVELPERPCPTDGPLLRYGFYRFILVFQHYHDRLLLLENCPAGESSRLPELRQRLKQAAPAEYDFQLQGDYRSPISDATFKNLVEKGRDHCARGDVFQLVLSRPFEQDFRGDSLQLYRALRSINPSPYLFYFDYGNYKILGSSPEAQLYIHKGEATLHPIAGTYRRSGDPKEDERRAQALLEDPKENAEHVMLVDLARNDLNRHCQAVKVAAYKELQRFSHVLHLVSRVTGRLQDQGQAFQVLSDTFPAGTLSGAPKYRALELIGQYEKQHRGFYGGCLGFASFDGSLNQAILIRSFLAQGNTLHYQAGAGIVIDSEPEKELQEVNNKVAALRAALSFAHENSFAL